MAASLSPSAGPRRSCRKRVPSTRHGSPRASSSAPAMASPLQKSHCRRGRKVSVGLRRIEKQKEGEEEAVCEATPPLTANIGPATWTGESSAEEKEKPHHFLPMGLRVFAECGDGNTAGALQAGLLSIPQSEYKRTGEEFVNESEDSEGCNRSDSKEAKKGHKRRLNFDDVSQPRAEECGQLVEAGVHSEKTVMDKSREEQGKGEPGPKRRKGKEKSTGKRERKRRKYCKEVVIDDTVFKPGDFVYVKVVDTAQNDEGAESDEEVEECAVCGEVEGGTMLECDCCLRGFHLSCLKPCLESVPEGDWFCATCIRHGRGGTCLGMQDESARTRHRTAKERLLAGELSVGEIKRLWKEESGNYWLEVLWYNLPEETHVGRQSHHARRELFRTQNKDAIDIASVLRHCWVMSPSAYARSMDEGDDVFLCAYEYNHAWQSFKRIHEDEEASIACQEQVQESSDESDEEYQACNEAESEPEDDDYDDYGSEYGDDSTAFGIKTGKKRGRRQKRGGHMKSQNKSQRNNGPRKPSANVRRGVAGVVKLVRSSAQRSKLSGLAKAQAALLPTAIPESLPCRETERAEIEKCVAEAVAGGSSSLGRCLYVSGVPGTGKTATVLEVMRSISRRSAASDLPPFQFVHINALRLPSPQHIFSVLHEELTGQAVTWRNAQELLEIRFSDSNKNNNQRPLVVLVDELDHLVTRTQNVLYSLFDWPTRSSARLTVIGIANTMDLPERLLPRIVSRMGLQRCTFRPYTREQLTQIVEARLEGIVAFQQQAVKLAAMKVAAVSGDVRRALELCRRAAEIAEARVAASQTPPSPSNKEQNSSEALKNSNEPVGTIELRDVDCAIHEMFEAPQMKLLGRCTLQEQIFLAAILMELRRTGVEETTFEKVARTHIDLCTNHGMPPPPRDGLSAISCRLGACRLLLTEAGGRHRHQKVQLNIPSDDIVFAFKKAQKVPWLLPHL